MTPNSSPNTDFNVQLLDTVQNNFFGFLLIYLYLHTGFPWRKSNILLQHLLDVYIYSMSNFSYNIYLPDDNHPNENNSTCYGHTLWV